MAKETIQNIKEAELKAKELVKDAEAQKTSIIEKAKESDVPIHRDDKLAETLSRLEIGEMIPPELYEVVAEILIFVDSMDKIKNKLRN